MSPEPRQGRARSSPSRERSPEELASVLARMASQTGEPEPRQGRSGSRRRPATQARSAVAEAPAERVPEPPAAVETPPKRATAPSPEARAAERPPSARRRPRQKPARPKRPPSARRRPRQKPARPKRPPSARRRPRQKPARPKRPPSGPRPRRRPRHRTSRRTSPLPSAPASQPLARPRPRQPPPATAPAAAWSPARRSTACGSSPPLTPAPPPRPPRSAGPRPHARSTGRRAEAASPRGRRRPPAAPRQLRPGRWATASVAQAAAGVRSSRSSSLAAADRAGGARRAGTGTNRRGRWWCQAPRPDRARQAGGGGRAGRLAAAEGDHGSRADHHRREHHGHPAHPHDDDRAQASAGPQAEGSPQVRLGQFVGGELICDAGQQRRQLFPRSYGCAIPPRDPVPADAQFCGQRPRGRGEPQPPAVPAQEEVGPAVSGAPGDRPPAR